MYELLCILKANVPQLRSVNPIGISVDCDPQALTCLRENNQVSKSVICKEDEQYLRQALKSY